MQNLKVRRAGFAVRKYYALFLERYKCLCPATWPYYKDKNNPREGVQVLLDFLKFKQVDDYMFGNTKIFIRSSQMFYDLETAFEIKKHLLVTKLKAMYRGYKGRVKFKKTKEACKLIWKKLINLVIILFKWR